MEDVYRIVEGVSTGAMLTGMFPYAIKYPHLIFSYAVHWIASIRYHMDRNPTTYYGDITLINIIINERLALHFQQSAPVVFIGAILSNVVFPPSPLHHNSVIALATVGTILCAISNPGRSGLYLTSFISTGILFYLSTWAEKLGERRLSMLLCVYYHLTLGIYSYLESSFYPLEGDRGLATSLLRYISWFCYVFSQTTRDKTMIAFQYQSVVSLMTATILAPLGIWQTMACLTSIVPRLSESVSREIHIFYLAYCISDVYHGMRYYPQFFPMIEGWLHHVMTGGYVLMCMSQGHYLPCSVSMIVEAPSIILFSSRVFYGHPTIVWLKKKFFLPSFILFRIVFLGIITVWLYRSNEIGVSVVVFSMLFSLLNLHWIAKMLQHKNERRS